MKERTEVIGILSGRILESPFRRLDARVRLFWMLIVSILAMLWSRPEALLILSATLMPVWVASRLTKQMLRSTIRLTPYLFFLLLLQLVPKFIFGGQSETYLFRFWGMDISRIELMKGVVETLRFYIMLQAGQVWLSTMDFGEMSAGIRQALPTKKGGTADRIMATIAFLLSIAYQFVPLIAGEMQTMVEVQRARGVDIARGNRLKQVKNLVRMAIPLFIRSLELVKNTGLALLNYAFQIQERSIYRNLQMENSDWIAMTVMLCFVTAAITAKTVFPWL